MNVRKCYQQLAEYKFQLLNNISSFICIYCGMSANTQDHVIPLSILANLTDIIEIQSYKVPACNECNTLAGAKYFNSFNEKKEFIRHQLEFKYQKILKIPHWTDDELQEMGSEAQRDIKAYLIKKEIILERIDYTSPDELDINEIFTPIKIVKQNTKMKFNIKEYSTFADLLTINDDTQTIAQWCISKNIGSSILQALLKRETSLVVIFSANTKFQSLKKYQIRGLKLKEKLCVKIT